MPIYRVTMKGRTSPLLLKADSAAKAKDMVVQVESLDAVEMAEAMGAGEKVWNSADPFPADAAPKGDADNEEGEK